MVRAADLPMLPARQRRREATLTELREHAERLVSDEGLEALTMHRLAALHGVRVAALYRYWPSKDALLTDLLGRVLDRLFDRIRQARSAVSPLERLVASAVVYLDFAETSPEGSALVTRMLAVPRPTLADDASASGLLPRISAFADELGRDFEAAREAGELGPGDDALRIVILWTALQGLVSARKMSRFPAFGVLPALERELVLTHFCGWGADRARVAAAIDAARTAAVTGRKS